MATLKERFLSAYASVPLPLRKEIIAIIGEEPYSWEAAYFEIKKNSDTAEKVLNMLSAIGVI